MFTLKNIGIHASRENTIFIREVLRSPIPKDLRYNGYSCITTVPKIIATLNTVHSGLLEEG